MRVGVECSFEIRMAEKGLDRSERFTTFTDLCAVEFARSPRGRWLATKRTETVGVYRDRPGFLCQLQARSSVSRSYVSRVESGEMTPSLGTIEKLVKCSMLA
jgi:transcriptional regulator with XRE-family HTH domain